MPNENNKIFHLGLSMAGAVSAGAYTAGFVDYLIEALNAWEEAKTWEEKDRGAIPMHQVSIDAIGGASAGGMVSMMTALAFYQKEYVPVKEPVNTKTGNLLYDNWVFLDDDKVESKSSDGGKTTFEKMLNLDDLENQSSVVSLLNSKPIDTIAERVFKQLPANASLENFPKYVSKGLRILITLTSLTPIKESINLSKIKSNLFNLNPEHNIYYHDVIAHFKTDYAEEEDKDKFLPFSPLDNQLDYNRDFLIKTTIATGAFPIGLAPRYFDADFTIKYLKNSLVFRNGLESTNEVFNEEKELNHNQKEFTSFTAVDGGTINNEPFDEVLRCLKQLHGEVDPKNPKYGTMLIDPFPNFTSATNLNYRIEGILNLIGSLIPTILNQARTKRSDVFATNLYKVMSFPRKYELGKIKEPLEYPLATGAIGGFGGFLDIKFRQHDFFLGRNNARKYLRHFLMLEYDPNDVNNLFHGVTEEAVNEFGKKYNDKIYMPIIPDVSKLHPNDDPNPTKFDIPDMPRLDRVALNKLKQPIRKRVKKILKIELDQRMSGVFWWLSKRFVISFVSKRITNWATKSIECDFTKRGM